MTQTPLLGLGAPFFTKSCPTGWIITCASDSTNTSTQTQPLFPADQDGQRDNAPHDSVQVCVCVNATQHACGLSGKGLFLFKEKRDEEGGTRPPSSHISFSGHIRAPDLCHDACPCVEMLRRVRPHRCESFNTELLVCTDEISALHQHVFIFHGQHNGIHGWESIQTCVGNTLVAANPLLFCAQDFMWTN